jgi:uncharacterized membrane protein
MTKTAPTSQPKSLQKVLPVILIIASSIGFICAFVLTVDKMQLLANPNFKPNCDLNPIISCGGVMNSKQSDVFGFSNPFLGIAAFPVLATVGVAMLAGATFKRWFWIGLQIGTLLGVAFIHWLFFQSVYRIGSLCPYCIVTWIVTITSFWYLLLYNIEQGNIAVRGKLKTLTSFARRHHMDILVAWFVIVTALILKHFWYYYGQRL